MIRRGKNRSRNLLSHRLGNTAGDTMGNAIGNAAVYLVIIPGLSLLFFQLIKVDFFYDPELLLMAILSVLVNLFVVYDPKDRFHLSLNMPFIICMALCFDLPTVLMVLTIGTLVYLKYLGFVRFLFYLSRLTLSISVAKSIIPLGIISNLNLRQDLLIVVFAIFIGDIMNLLFSVKIHCLLYKKRFLRTFFHIWLTKWVLIQPLFYSSGIIMAFSYQREGITGLLMAIIPVIGIYYFLKAKSDLAREQKRANTDALTNLWNRHAFINWWEKIFRITSIGVLMIDIDNFKTINDTFGHYNGDKVLKEIASIINKSIRSSDYLFRYGGEEFVVLTPDSKADEVNYIALRIKKAITGAKISNIENHPVTVSIGVIYQSLLGKKKKEIVPDELIRKADKAMYHAKQNGKNRICIYNKFGISPVTE